MKRLMTGIWALALGASASGQSELHVPSEFPTIKQALGAAAHGDTVWVAPGTYYEGSLSFGGKDLQLRSEAGPEVTILDGSNAQRLFVFRHGETTAALLEGFTLRAGRVFGELNSATHDAHGGGILIQDASPTIRDCHFMNCRAAPGEAGSPGYLEVTFNIFNPYHEFQAGDGGQGGHGGAIYAINSAARIDRCRFLNNRAGAGGAGGEGFTGGPSSGLASGGYGGDGAHGGTGGDGGAIYVSGGGVRISNSLFTSNDPGPGGAGGKGGTGGEGFYFLFGYTTWGGDGGRGGNAGTWGRGTIAGSSMKVINCTIAHNGHGAAASAGAGGSGGLGSTNGTAGYPGESTTPTISGISKNTGDTVANSIVWNNQGVEVYPNAANVHHSIVDGYSGSNSTILGVDPRFVLGPATFELSDDSPCIDAGDNDEVSEEFDLTGNPRRFDHPLVADSGFADSPSGAVVDMGAREVARGFVLPLGCAPPTGSLVHLEGTPELGATLVLGVDNPFGTQNPGSYPYLALSPGKSPEPCGTLLEGLGMDGGSASLWVDFALWWKVNGPVWPGVGMPAQIPLPFPDAPELVGLNLHAQALMIDPSTGSGTLSDALRLVVGP